MTEISIFTSHLPTEEQQENICWDDLWSSLWLAFNDHPAILDIANDESIEYATEATGSYDEQNPENAGRQIYYEMGYLLGRLGLPLKRTLGLIESADKGTWADDDYTLESLPLESATAGHSEGAIQHAITHAQRVVEGDGLDAYENPSEFVFAAAVRMVEAYVNMKGDNLVGALQGIFENLDPYSDDDQEFILHG